MELAPSSLGDTKDEDILALIKKHPYFKNPCKYPIRIISIMKYLKKKGFNVSEKDIDLKVDQLIASISDVDKIEFGLYVVKK